MGLNMSIIEFPFLSARKVVDALPADWSQQDLADFLRAHDLLRRNGVGVGMDRGLSDRHEPWFVFYELSSQDVFLHVARINGRCVLACETLGIRMEAAGIGELVEGFEERVRLLVGERSRAAAGSNVVIHPAARIILAVSAVFLMFKADQSGVAHAAEPGQDSARNKHDIAHPGLRPALTRLFDHTEAPAAAAMAAGLLLAMDAGQAPGEVHFSTSPVAETVAMSIGHDTASSIVIEEIRHNDRGLPDTDSPALTHGAPVREVADAVQPHEFATIIVGSEARQDDDGKYTLSGEKVFSQDMVVAFLPPVEVLATERQVSAPSVPETAAAGAAPEAVRTITALLAQPASVQKAPVESVKEAPAAEKPAVVAVTDSSPAKDVVVDAPVAVVPDIVQDEPGTDVVDTPAVINAVGEIVIADLPRLSGEVGFFYETSVRDSSAKDIAWFLNSFNYYEVEMASGAVMIEQAGITSEDVSNIGIWRNVYKDGSSITIIGLAHIVDDILTMV